MSAIQKKQNAGWQPTLTHTKQQQKKKTPRATKMAQVTKLYKLSAPLQSLLGKRELSHPAAVKEFWAYVKEHKLQDPADGRIIRPNQEMKDVFKVNSDIKFTQVMGLLSKHLEKPTPSA